MTNLLILLGLTRKVRNQYRDRLQARFPEVPMTLVDHHSKVGPHIAGADALVTFTPMMTPKVLEQAQKLKWIQTLGTGVDNLIDQPTLRKDVIVTNVRGIHGPPVSEAALATMLALARNLPGAVRGQDAREWRRWPAQLLHNKTVGIFGVGLIAEALAPICKAFGMRVVGVSSAPRAVAGFDRMHSRDELPQVVGDFDFFVLLTPLTPATRNSIDAKVLAAMKPSSFLDQSRPRRRGRRASPGRGACAKAASPAPRSMCSTRSRCRPIIRSGRWRTSSSPPIRAASATSISTMPCRPSKPICAPFSRATSAA